MLWVFGVFVKKKKEGLVLSEGITSAGAALMILSVLTIAEIYAECF